MVNGLADNLRRGLSARVVNGVDMVGSRSGSVMVREMDMLRVAVGQSRYLGSSLAFPALEEGLSGTAGADSG